jgi:2-iminobutanoate/2-iminopropanoate deaminase
MPDIITIPNAPAAIGPYVQGVDLGNMVFTSGQLPIDPATGEIFEDVSNGKAGSFNDGLYVL